MQLVLSMANHVKEKQVHPIKAVQVNKPLQTAPPHRRPRGPLYRQTVQAPRLRRNERECRRADLHRARPSARIPAGQHEVHRHKGGDPSLAVQP